MLGYLMWTTDRPAALARARTTTANPGITRNQRPAVTAATVPGRRHPAPPPSRHRHPARQPGRPALLAPKLAACCKIAMSIAMGYMLILML